MPELVAFVGDSNMLLAASAVGLAHREPFVMLGRAGQGIDGWEQPLAELHNKVNPDRYVVNLGINDTHSYDQWEPRARRFLRLLDGPVLWSNLPWEIEPAPRRAGCLAINAALARLDVTVADWASVANDHPEWLKGGPGEVHLNDAGCKAWADCVANLLSRDEAPVTRTGTP